ncbi:MAG: DUF2167 domain-containing protein [Planctomycetota bacterium]
MSKTRSLPSLVAALALTGMFLPAQQGEPSAQEPKAEAGAAAQDPQAEAVARFAGMFASLKPQTGTVQLRDHGVLNLGEGWLWLAEQDGVKFLHELGNTQIRSVDGVALPPDYPETGIFAVYQHSKDGHVEDDDQDFDELLEHMQEMTRESNQERKRLGLAAMTLVGWAEPPHYDKDSHKLYWAKKLKVEGQDELTLNYNVQVLGRVMAIEVVGVGGIEQLAEVDARCKELLAGTEFVDGKRYSDFDPEYDKIAAYGIGGLIAGKVALKVGLFAKLGVVLLKFLKPILVGVALLGGLLVKVFTGKKAQPERVRVSAAGGKIVDKADELE